MTEPSNVLSFCKQLQEIPHRTFRGKEISASPILRITGSDHDSLQFKKPVTIRLPLPFTEESCEVPDMSSCCVRIWFLELASDESDYEKWTDINDGLIMPESFDKSTMAIEFSVMRLSGYVTFVTVIQCVVM